MCTACWQCAFLPSLSQCLQQVQGAVLCPEEEDLVHQKFVMLLPVQCDDTSPQM